MPTGGVLNWPTARFGTRVLAHPHVTEQPFTRSQSGFDISADAVEVFIRTSCIIDGWAVDAVAFTIP